MKLLRHSLLKIIPPASRHRIVELKNAIWGGWRHHFYSHFGEDAFIDAYFRHKKHGFYVDVGAHHPKRYSNTALLYERGWHGINIEPDGHLISVFRRQRPGDINIHAGVGLYEGVIDFYRFSDPAVNTFSRENAERLKKKKWLKEIAVEKVKVRTLADVLNENLPVEVGIDFLNIDVEDLDLDVLKSNDWDRFRPTLIAVEDRKFNLLNPSASEIFSYLTDREYVFMAQLGLTLIFVNKTFITT